MPADPDPCRLTGPGAEELLRCALGSRDEELVAWRVRQVDVRPASPTTVAYDVTVRGADGESRQVLTAGTGPDAGPGALPLPGGAPVAVWRFPLDPALPALATAVDETAVRSLLSSYGVPPGRVRLDVRSYRPRRRAVVEVGAGGRRVFLKVVRPDVVQGLHERHRVLAAAGLPVARSLGWTPQGLVVLDGLPGVPLRTRLREGGPGPNGTSLLHLLDRLPRQLCALPPRRSWTDAVEHYAGVTATALPEEAERCTQLAAAVLARVGDRPADGPTHGDFYEAQLLLDGDRLSGLLDVDAAGPGRRADDLACLLAHVDVLAQSEPAHADSSRALLATWLADFDRRVDPAELRARVAGVVVSLATGPHRVQQPGWPEHTRARLGLAERWLESGAARRR